MTDVRTETGQVRHDGDLFTPVEMGRLRLRNRIVMAPMTRMRADSDGVPSEHTAEYYRQRAGFGLIVSEGIFPSPIGKGYCGQPGLVSKAQIAAWSQVTDAVHERGGSIVAQLMHSGRVTHQDITGTKRVLAPSGIALTGMAHTPRGKQPHPVPQSMTDRDLQATSAEFVVAAENALRAGFDGVEMHGANGYLLHQFLSPHANVRTDAYGGSPEARARYVIEATESVAAAIGADRVGIRLSPENGLQDVIEDDTDETVATYEALLSALSGHGLAYLSVLHKDLRSDLVGRLRAAFDGPVVMNSGFDEVTGREEAAALVAQGHADAVAVGRLAIANPDLVERWARRHAENHFDASTFYTAGARGYTDYPGLASDSNGSPQETASARRQEQS